MDSPLTFFQKKNAKKQVLGELPFNTFYVLKIKLKILIFRSKKIYL